MGVIIAASAFLAGTGTSRAQTVLYNATTGGTSNTQPTFHYLQQLTLAGADTSYEISFMTLGLNWTDLSASQSVVLDFYLGADLSAASANALAGATFLNEVAFVIPPPNNTGSFLFSLAFDTPVTVPSSTFDIVVSLKDAAGTAYSTGSVNGRFTLGGGVPDIGSSPGFVWSDADLDGVFTGTEQTQFGDATAANIRMSVTAAQAVPEPGAVAWTASGLTVLLLAASRRRAAARRASANRG